MKAPQAIDMAATGRNISRLRKKSGITVRQLQALMGFATPQAVYRWQRGETLPSLDNMIMLSGILDVKIDDIIVCTEL